MDNIFLFISTFAAFFVKAITGFGNTLVLGTLFSFIVPNRITTPIDLVFSIPTNAYIVWKDRKSISLKVVIPLALMMLLGVIPGTFLLKVGSDWILKSVLGLIIVGLAIEMLTRKPAEQDKNKTNYIFLIIIGVISGVMAGLYGISALLVAYISRTTNTEGQFRANICCIFLVDTVFRFFLYIYTGILNKEAMLLALYLSPAVLIGMMLGIKVYARMKEAAVKKTVIGLLIISGSILFFKNIVNIW